MSDLGLRALARVHLTSRLEIKMSRIADRPVMSATYSCHSSGGKLLRDGASCVVSSAYGRDSSRSMSISSPSCQVPSGPRS